MVADLTPEEQALLYLRDGTRAEGTKTGRLLRAPRPPEPHPCKHPGRWECRKLGIQLGDLWECDTCSDVWEFASGYDSYYWERKTKHAE